MYNNLECMMVWYDIYDHIYVYIYIQYCMYSELLRNIYYGYIYTHTYIMHIYMIYITYTLIYHIYMDV